MLNFIFCKLNTVCKLISGSLVAGGEGGIRTLDTLARMPDFESSAIVEHSCGFHDDLGLQKHVFVYSGTRIESGPNYVLQTKSSGLVQPFDRVFYVNNAQSWQRLNAQRAPALILYRLILPYPIQLLPADL